MTLRIAGIYRYPLKSGAAEALDRGRLTIRGLAGDRAWMLIDSAGAFVTGRTLPRLCVWGARQTERGLCLTAPDGQTRWARLSSGRVEVEIWGDRGSAALAQPAISAWLSQHLGAELRLVYADAAFLRHADRSFAPSQTPLSFADGFPVLVTTDGALAALNDRLERPVSMARFRPNFVIEGAAAGEADTWTELRIGAVRLSNVKPCSRCVFINVDPRTGEAGGPQPLATLASFRRRPEGVIFGHNFVVRVPGEVRVGDRVEGYV